MALALLRARHPPRREPMHRAAVRVFALSVLLAAVTQSDVRAADQTILGSQLVVKDPGIASKRSVSGSAKEKGSINAIVGNPTVGGGVLEVLVNGSAASAQRFVLPQGTSSTGKFFWSTTGSGYQYRDTKGQNG